MDGPLLDICKNAGLTGTLGKSNTLKHEVFRYEGK